MTETLTHIQQNPNKTAKEIAKAVKQPVKAVRKELYSLIESGKIKQEANYNQSFTYKEKK